MMRTPKQQLNPAIVSRIIAARERVASNFDQGNWEEMGLHAIDQSKSTATTACCAACRGGGRGLRGNVLAVIRQIVERNPQTLPIIERYLDEKYPGESRFISAKPAERRIAIARTSSVCPRRRTPSWTSWPS